MSGRALRLGAMVCIGAARVAAAQAPLSESSAAEQREPLRWIVAENAIDCPGAAEFRRRLVQRMGMDPFAVADAPEFEVRLRQERSKFIADICEPAQEATACHSMGGDAATCDELVNAVVLAFSVLLAPNPAERAPERPQKRNVCPEATYPEPLSPVCPRAPKRDTRSAWLAVGPAFAHNEFPQSFWGEMLAAAVGLAGPWELTAGADYFGVEQMDVDSVSFSLTLADLWLGLGLTLPLTRQLHWRMQLAPSASMLDHYRNATTLPASGVSHELLGGVRLASQAVAHLGPVGMAVGFSGVFRDQWALTASESGSERVLWTSGHFGARTEILLECELP